MEQNNKNFKYALCLVNIQKLGTKTFSYLIKEEDKDKIKIGQAVSLPFGKTRKIQGWVVGFSNYLEEGIKAKEIEEILEPEPLFNIEYLKLLENIAQYYFCDLQTVLKCAIPEKFFEKNLKKYREPKIKNKIFDTLKENSDIKLTPAQEKIYNEITKISPKEALLYGITGSGKTEIYFKLIEDTIKQGKKVLFLAPEIALVTQLTKRTIKKFGKDNVAIWHSSITEAEKYKVWQKLKNNEIDILFGARSAVFAPLKDLGLIIIDECHDTSYKQTMPAPRYDARYVARLLAEFMGAKVVMGSATPDISDYYRAINSNSLFTLKERFNNQNLPKVSIVDMKMEQYEKNYGVFSKYLIKKIKETKEEGHQTVLLINRRGYSTYTQCMECGEVAVCPRCEIPLIYHKQDNSHKCHWCNYEIKNMEKCQKCGGECIENIGYGVERIEKIAREIFKDFNIERFDSDILSRKNEHVDILNRFENGEIDILIGTQMIAKGLDNKNVTLVGVINADMSFNLPDYRSSERGFSLLTQVAGRSGRGEDKGEVVFQVYNTENEYINLSKNQDYETFYDAEIETREALDYPPFSNIIRLVLVSKNNYRCERASLEITKRFQDFVEKQGLSERLNILGPAPCVLEKIKNEYRFNIIVKNKMGERGHRIASSFINNIIMPDDIKLIIDVDPIDIL